MVIINTPSIEDYTTVVNWAFKQGMRWCSGHIDIREDFWGVHGSETCIRIDDSKLSFASKRFYMNNFYVDIFDMDKFYRYAKMAKHNNFAKKFDLR